MQRRIFRTLILIFLVVLMFAVYIPLLQAESVPNDLILMNEDDTEYPETFDRDIDGLCIYDGNARWNSFAWGDGTCSSPDDWDCAGGGCTSTWELDSAKYYGYGQPGISETPRSAWLYHNDEECLSGETGSNRERTEAKTMGGGDAYTFLATGSIDVWKGFVWYVPSQTWPGSASGEENKANLMQIFGVTSNPPCPGGSFMWGFTRNQDIEPVLFACARSTATVADDCAGSSWSSDGSVCRYCYYNLGTPGTNFQIGSNWQTLSHWNHVVVHVKEGVGEAGIVEMWINGVKLINGTSTSCQDLGTGRNSTMDNFGCFGARYNTASGTSNYNLLQWGIYGYYINNDDYQDWRDEDRIYVGTGGSYADVVPPIWPADPDYEHASVDPYDGETGVNPDSITFVSAPYSETPDYDIGVYTHYSGRWRVYSTSGLCAAGGTGDVKDSGWLTGSKTSHTFNSFSPNTQYWWTVEHRNVVDGSNSEGARYYDSNPSTCATFTTADSGEDPLTVKMGGTGKKMRGESILLKQ